MLYYTILHFTLHFTALNDTTLICSIALHLNTIQYLTLAYLIHLFPAIRKLLYTLHYITLYTIGTTLLFATLEVFVFWTV